MTQSSGHMQQLNSGNEGHNIGGGMGVFYGGADRSIGQSLSFLTLQHLHRGVMMSLSQYQTRHFNTPLLWILIMYNELRKQVCIFWMPFPMLEMEKIKCSWKCLHSDLLCILVHCCGPFYVLNFR